MKAEELNALALVIADILAKDKSKKCIAEIKILLQQVICNLCTYLIE